MANSIIKQTTEQYKLQSSYLEVTQASLIDSYMSRAWRTHRFCNGIKLNVCQDGKEPCGLKVRKHCTGISDSLAVLRQDNCIYVLQVTISELESQETIVSGSSKIQTLFI